MPINSGAAKNINLVIKNSFPWHNFTQHFPEFDHFQDFCLTAVKMSHIYCIFQKKKHSDNHINCCYSTTQWWLKKTWARIHCQSVNTCGSDFSLVSELITGIDVMQIRICRRCWTSRLHSADPSACQSHRHSRLSVKIVDCSTLMSPPRHWHSADYIKMLYHLM